jgi:very-short-patch-repair endonuclease
MFIKIKKFINYNGGLKPKVKKLRRNMTLAERKLWYEFLRGYRYRFVRQKTIGNYILDFYCQKLKLGIEIDGETHLGNKNEEYDKNRTRELEKLGIKILRFWNDNILEGLGEVENIIENKIKER